MDGAKWVMTDFGFAIRPGSANNHCIDKHANQDTNGIRNHIEPGKG